MQQLFHLMKEQGFKNHLQIVLNDQNVIDGEVVPIKYLGFFLGLIR